MLDHTTPLVLAHLRKRKGLLFLEVSQRTSHSMAALSRWESGHVSPRLDELLALLDVYGSNLVEFADLRTVLGVPAAPSPIAPKAAAGE